MGNHIVSWSVWPVPRKPEVACSKRDTAVQLARAVAPKSRTSNAAVYGRCHRDSRRVVRIQADRGTPFVAVGGWISKLSTWRTVLLRLVLVSERWRSVVTSLASSVVTR